MSFSFPDNDRFSLALRYREHVAAIDLYLRRADWLTAIGQDEAAEVAYDLADCCHMRLCDGSYRWYGCTVEPEHLTIRWLTDPCPF